MDTDFTDSSAPARRLELRIDPRGAVAPLAVVAVGLCAASLGGEVLRHGLQVNFRGLASWQGYFNVDREANIPTWFQVSLLLTCALTAWTIADDARSVADRWARHWRLLAVAFCYLSLDELAQLHERADEPLHVMFGTSGALLWAWVLLAVPMVVAFGLFYLRFLSALPRRTRRGLLLAAALYVGGAVGIEMVGSYVYSVSGPDTVAYDLAATLEEAMEMAGMLLALATMGAHAARGRAVSVRPRKPAGRRVRSAAERPQVVLRPGAE